MFYLHVWPHSERESPSELAGQLRAMRSAARSVMRLRSTSDVRLWRPKQT
jgi:hypothetical protein